MSTTRQDASARDRAARLEAAGARVELVADDAPGGFLAGSFAALTRLGVMSMTLEGGPTLHAAAWAAGLVDRVQIFDTAATLGPGAVPWLRETVVDVDRLFDRRTVSFGDDVMVEGYVHRAD